MHRVMNGTQKGWQTLMAELYRERTSPDHVMAEEPMYSEDAEHGKEYEDAARASAELELGCEIVQVGFALHPILKWLGASVDGLIISVEEQEFVAKFREIKERHPTQEDLDKFLGYVDATVEIKVFNNLSNHAYVWTNKRVLDKYLPQVHTQQLVFDAPRSIFVSYHEQMPDPKARLAIVEVARDVGYQQALLGRAQRFQADFEQYVANGGNLPLLASTVPKRF